MDEDGRQIISPIIWPSTIKSQQCMTFESLGLLYNVSQKDVFGDHLGLIVSCSNITGGGDPTLLKLDIITTPHLRDAMMRITHEVVPKLGNCSQIIPVNESLLVAGYDEGCLIGVKNFGFKRTYHSDVRNRLCYHTAEINCLAANSQGTLLASGGVRDGEISFYRVTKDEIELMRSTNIADTMISGLCFLDDPNKEAVDYSSNITDKASGEPILAWSTIAGEVGLIDTRTPSDVELKSGPIYTSQDQPVNFTTICSVPELAGSQVFLGTKDGQILGIDFRQSKGYVHKHQACTNRSIRRIKKVKVRDGDKVDLFLAYTNHSEHIEIYNLNTKELDKRWKCDRDPQQIQRDFMIIDNRIISCGNQTSVGSWLWDPSNEFTVNQKIIN